MQQTVAISPSVEPIAGGNADAVGVHMHSGDDGPERVKTTRDLAGLIPEWVLRPYGVAVSR